MIFVANIVSPFAESRLSSQNQPLPSECQTCRGRRVKSEDEESEDEENDLDENDHDDDDIDDDYGNGNGDDDVAKRMSNKKTRWRRTEPGGCFVSQRIHVCTLSQ